MSAEILREAAALMRERAEAATEGICPEWTRVAVRHIARNCDMECYHEDADPMVAKYHADDDYRQTWDRYDDAEHIASWSPDVALAVADWLEEVHVNLSTYNATTATAHRALTVARAYLGRDS